ncbi:MAG: tail fiber domain-containing protein [Candidatus Fonsibacter lacus]|nr:tail fiber domain-containing protein [Candidatus Fonsibacter lacus]
MTLDASGVLYVGATSGQASRLNLVKIANSAVENLLWLQNDGTGYKGTKISFGEYTSEKGYVTNQYIASGPSWTTDIGGVDLVRLFTASTERARITSGGDLLVGTTTVNSTSGITLRADGIIVAKGVYNTVVSLNTRDIYMDSDGYFGYISSTRASKTNISNLNNVDWLHQLNPVAFNYRKIDRETNERTDEPETEKQYGLIAEEVEPVNADICFYDVVDGNPELRGVNYSKLIAPLLKLAQQQQIRIEKLEAEMAALKGA